MTESTSAVEQAVQARIEAARIRIAAAKRRRAELSAARQRGLAARHAAKLRYFAARNRPALLVGDNQGGTGPVHPQASESSIRAADETASTATTTVAIPDRNPKGTHWARTAGDAVGPTPDLGAVQQQLERIADQLDKEAPR
ncbi:hypothetical protein [Streptomyces sp. rh34]|uniref:hypothetical protein n=1 Tax=Streptomyces sp. rh34 TaxID=2034272 RepID=UPI000BF1FBA0|nr:hypothetical protein [Streptomyces sp. rh34]